jgi:hypothetical protein
MGVNYYPPLTENVNVSNEPNVNVINTPNVSVTNTPTVNIGGTNNVRITDSGNTAISATNPFHTRQRALGTNNALEDIVVPTIHIYTEVNNLANSLSAGIHTSLNTSLRIKLFSLTLQAGSDTTTLDGGYFLLQWRNQAGTATIDLAKYRLSVNQILRLDFPNGIAISPYTGGRLQIVNQSGETYNIHAIVALSEV